MKTSMKNTKSLIVSEYIGGAEVNTAWPMMLSFYM